MSLEIDEVAKVRRKPYVAEAKTIIFVGNARDYHAIDWYRAIKRICFNNKVIFVTDLVKSEGHEKIVTNDDEIIELFNIDRFLFANQSRWGNTWRNLVKLIAFPMQAKRLKTTAIKYPNAIFHAHTMYYMFLSWVAGIRSIGTPQGSEILVRPISSRLYRHFAIKSLVAAENILVDSTSLQAGIAELCGKKAHVIQNGIDVPAISRSISGAHRSNTIVSMRGLYPLYRIDEIFVARTSSREKPKIFLAYPLWEDGYKAKICQKLRSDDRDLGRLAKNELYQLLGAVRLVVSIPRSDSSPRSVYEAIFCGACVAVTENSWIDLLPPCMKSRLYIVDLEDRLWLEKALEYADTITEKPFHPSEAALDLFDQERSMKSVAERFYGIGRG